MFSVHTKTLNSSCLKSVYEKVRFRDGLVWTGLKRRNKLRFQILRRSMEGAWIACLKINS